MTLERIHYQKIRQYKNFTQQSPTHMWDLTRAVGKKMNMKIQKPTDKRKKIENKQDKMNRTKTANLKKYYFNIYTLPTQSLKRITTDFQTVPRDGKTGVFGTVHFVRLFDGT